MSALSGALLKNTHTFYPLSQSWQWSSKSSWQQFWRFIPLLRLVSFPPLGFFWCGASSSAQKYPHTHNQLRCIVGGKERCGSLLVSLGSLYRSPNGNYRSPFLCFEHTHEGNTTELHPNLLIPSTFYNQFLNLFYCEAQGKGRAQGRLRKSLKDLLLIIDCRLSMSIS